MGRRRILGICNGSKTAPKEPFGAYQKFLALPIQGERDPKIFRWYFKMLETFRKTTLMPFITQYTLR